MNKVRTYIGKLGAAMLAALPVALLAVGVAAPAHAGGDYGPDTCLEGWVWRDAFTNDHVCVTQATRSQAANDNGQAAARRDPNGGPFGPDTCLQGWVWREAVPSDHVCVTPATRSQAADDNGQAAARRDSELLWHTTYTIPPHCNGDVCSITSTDSIPRFRLAGDHINIGTVRVELRALNGTLRQSWSVYAAPNTAPGGRFSLDTGVFDCRKANDSYFRVYDSTSFRWSAPHYVSSNCHVL
jgi:hypothetical protein